MIPCLGRFSQIPELLQSQGIELESVDGVLLDVGVSSMQMDQSDRGFAISQDGPLDMRMNPR